MSADPPALDLYCPNCQYNLHGLSGNRCPECGSEFDLSALSRSRVPWYQRRDTGRVRAWWQTCWMAAFRTRELAISVQAPASYAEARRFWLITATLLALPWCVLAWLVPVELPRTDTLGISTSAFSSVPQWLVYNLLIPMQGAYCFRPVVMACAVLSILCITGGVSYLFQVIALPRRMQDRAAALSLFSCGAIVAGTVPMAALGAVLGVFGIVNSGGDLADSDAAMLPLIAMLFVLGTVLVWWVSLVLLYRRMCGATFLRTATVTGLVPLLILAALLVCLVILPWSIGMVRIMLAFP